MGPTLVAHGVWLKRVFVVIGIAVCYVSWAYFIPYLNNFTVKQIARHTCGELVKETRWRLPKEQHKALANFPRQVAVETKNRFTTENYSFKVAKHPTKKGDYTCTFKLAYVRYDTWPLLDDYINDMPKIRSVYRQSNTQDYRKDY